jgi:hypothetical protein
MTNGYIYEKLNTGELISTNELALLLLAEMHRLHAETKDDMALFSRLTMQEFDKVYTKFEIVTGKADLVDLKECLVGKIEASHTTTNRRIDWIQSRISKLA